MAKRRPAKSMPVVVRTPQTTASSTRVRLSSNWKSAAPDQSLLAAVEAPRQSGQPGGRGEHDQLGRDQVHPQGGRGGRAVSEGSEPATVGRPAQGQQPDGDEGEDDTQEDQVGLVALERQAEQGYPARPSASRSCRRCARWRRRRCPWRRQKPGWPGPDTDPASGGPGGRRWPRPPRRHDGAASRPHHE